MADEYGDKTEAPTPRRRQEAREQGNIARSADLTAAVVILSALVLLDWNGPSIVAALKLAIERCMSVATLSDHRGSNIGALLISVFGSVGRAMLPFLLGIALMAVIANLAQVGFFFNSKRLQPNFKALNPQNGIKRLFGQGAAKMQLVMNFAKLTVVALIAYSAVHGRIAQIVSVQQLHYMQILHLASEIIYAIVLRLGIFLLALAILDYIWQRFRTEKQLKMTKQEVKDEMKRMEGDPLIKQRRRQLALQRMTQAFKQSVPTADVVVTNPTHFAIAIKYDPKTMTAPRVVAKGQDILARRIREIAVEHGVPILERPPLARALFKMVQVGQEIPEQFYSAVAEILAYVYELTGKLQSERRNPDPNREAVPAGGVA